MRVVHVSAHVGGGVGSVLRELFDRLASYGVENILCCLDKCESNFNGFSSAVSTYQMLAFDKQGSFGYELNRADIVLLHYWNHPLTTRLLMSDIIPPSRLVIWSHNSGLYEPHIIPAYLSQLASTIVFSSNCSFAAQNISELATSDSCDLRVVHSIRSLDDYLLISDSRHYNQTCRSLLYVGTVSKAKMHPSTPEIFAALSRLGCNVRVVGGPDEKLLAAEVSALGGTIDVCGPVVDVLPYYRESDVFIYPLREDHYGTGEQVILEAMAAGLPIVAFANPAEVAILEDGVSGFLVSTAKEFIDAVIYLCADSVHRNEISKNALARVRKEFSPQAMADQFIEIFRDSISLGKKPITFPCAISEDERVSVLGTYALHSFFGEDLFYAIKHNSKDSVALVFAKIKSVLTCANQAFKWTDGSKSTPFHYLRYSPDDPDMRLLTDQIRAQCDSFEVN